MIISWGVCFVFISGMIYIISGGDVCNVLMLWGVAGASVFLFISWGNVLLWGEM